MSLRYIFLVLRIVCLRLIWLCGGIASLKLGKKASRFSDINSETLILVPHADDEWVGCSQLIQKGKNIHVLYLDFPKYHNDMNANIRCDELTICSEKYGFKLYIHNEGEKMYYKILDVIIKYNIKQVFIPSFWDWHPDHLKAICYVQQVLIMNKNLNVNLYCYQVSCPILSSYNMYYMQIEKKWKEFHQCYRSQKNLPVFRFKLHEVLNGIYYKVGIVPIEVYKKIDILNLKTSDFMVIEELYNSINDIALIRKKSELYFNSFDNEISN